MFVVVVAAVVVGAQHEYRPLVGMPSLPCPHCSEFRVELVLELDRQHDAFGEGWNRSRRTSPFRSVADLVCNVLYRLSN